MTTPNQGIPPTVQTLLGIGAFQIGGGLTNFGQGINENFVRQLIVGAGTAIWTGVENIAGIIDNIAQWLAGLPLEALRMFQYFIPGSIPSQFIDIATSVETIVAALSIQKLLMSLDDFESWLTDTYHILLTEVHQILDAIGGLIITPITERVSGFVDWLASLAGFRIDTEDTLVTIGGFVDDLIYGVGGTAVGDVVSAIGHGVQAGIDIAEILTDAGISTIAELVALIVQGVSALGYITSLIASIPGAVDTTDVGTAINSGVTALTHVLTLISGVAGTTIGDVADAIIDAGADASSALTKIATVLTNAGVASEAALGTAVSSTVTGLQNLLNAIANALGHIGSSFTISNIQTYLANIPIANIANLPGYLTNMATTGLYDAAAGFGNMSTSLLKNLTAAGATIGQFNAAALTGAFNTAVTISGNAVSTLFNSSGILASQLTGGLNAAVTFGGTALSTLFTNLNSTGQFSASGLTGALNTAVTFGGTALSTLLQYLNGSGQFNAAQITGAINTAVTYSGITLSTLLQYLNSSGQFNAAQITGALNTATTISGNALSTLFNSSGLIASQITGAFNGAVTLGGVSFTNLLQNLNSSGQLLGSAITGAINTSATIGGTALSTLATNWNAAVTNVNSLISGVGGTAITDVNTYLQNIPNTAVLGLSGFGTNIGNTITALSDGVWQGLRAFLGIPSGVGPPQVSSAAQQVRVDLNNATDIATLARTIQAAQAITKQSFLSIDPSADPVFPLSNIAGASPTTVPVVQTKSVMGAILLPDVSTKESVTWLGGPLTNITAVYVNLYTVNKTTGVFTRFHASSNIIGSLSNPGSGTAWNFYNLPMANYFQVTPDGTGGTTTPVLAIGDYVVVEITTAGTGTYNVVGFTNGIPTHTTIFPKGLGISRNPGLKTISFDAVGAAFKQQSTVSTISGTFSNTATAGDLVLVAVSMQRSASASYTAFTRTATYDPTGANLAMASLGAINFNNSNAGWVEVFALNGVPGGTKNIAVSVTGGSGSFLALIANSASYSNVISVGAAQLQTGVVGGSALNNTFTSATGNTLFNVMAIQNSGGATVISAYSKTSRYNGTAANSTNSTTVVLGDAAGSASVNITATATNSTWAVAIGVDLQPDVATPPSSISSPTYDVSTPWIALAGAAGRSQHAAETVEFETAGTYTYTVPAWIQDGDYIDIVPIGSGAGGSYLGNYLTTYNGGALTTYKGGGGGHWNPIRLRYGSAYDIPTGTTTFTVNVGAGGAGGAYPGASYAPAHGSAGNSTTVVITGYPTITATGGTADSSAVAQGGTGVAGAGGASPGNTTHQGVTYFGGGNSIQSEPGSTPGNAPGGGGAAHMSYHSSGQNYDLSGAAGGPGAVYITAVQN